LLFGDAAPFDVPLEDPLVVLNVGAGVGAHSEATREAGAAPMSLERRTMFGGLVAVQGTWKIAGAA